MEKAPTAGGDKMSTRTGTPSCVLQLLVHVAVARTSNHCHQSGLVQLVVLPGPESHTSMLRSLLRIGALSQKGVVTHATNVNVLYDVYVPQRPTHLHNVK